MRQREAPTLWQTGCECSVRHKKTAVARGVTAVVKGGDAPLPERKCGTVVYFVSKMGVMRLSSTW